MSLVFVLIILYSCLALLFGQLAYAFACKAYCFRIASFFSFFRFFFRILGNLEQKLFYRPPNNWYNSVICTYKRGVFLSLLELFPEKFPRDYLIPVYLHITKTDIINRSVLGWFLLTMYKVHILTRSTNFVSRNQN